MAATELKLEPLAMQEAVEFWRNKVQLSPREFSKLSDEAKVMAFGVSGIAKGSELTFADAEKVKCGLAADADAMARHEELLARAGAYARLYGLQN